MKLISVGLFLYFVLIKFGTALECFSCAEDKCLNPDLWQKITNCGKTASGNHIGACLKEVYINADKKEITQRRCVIADKDASGKPTFACTNGQNKECKFFDSGSNYSKRFNLGI
ncbi:hypothetical protein GWI33_007355 [Rhynchophorus ferrugineus]|uniref:Uncharacterized protein n=1 Tax=Rhynchophorus ferrugineus TaxID=354439 RepID=A0A834IKE1_RHYFE|nr:hypothetical protein GWI33_007355 [Rhynchophorus ferrugineus]